MKVNKNVSRTRVKTVPCGRVRIYKNYLFLFASNIYLNSVVPYSFLSGVNGYSNKILHPYKRQYGVYLLSLAHILVWWHVLTGATVDQTMVRTILYGLRISLEMVQKRSCWQSLKFDLWYFTCLVVLVYILLTSPDMKASAPLWTLNTKQPVSGCDKRVVLPPELNLRCFALQLLRDANLWRASLKWRTPAAASFIPYSDLHIPSRFETTAKNVNSCISRSLE